ncbi:hypothetical protein C8Q74DRAFT_1370862 [Fomes fomentarius]|nr:hypothetical protein C8Q74DRAFT_1370862 [Fomes fomentarius]
MTTLLAPVLATPLLKVPVLVTCGVLSYMNVNVPRDAPQVDERKKRDETDFFTRGMAYKMLLLRMCGALVCGVAFAEAATIVAHAYPSSPLSAIATSTLVPADSYTPSPRLTPSFVLGSGLIIVGGVLRIWSYRTLGRFFTAEICLQKDHRLSTSGPYSLVRHPSYLAVGLVVVGELIAHLGPGSYLKETEAWHRSPLTKAARACREDEMLRVEFEEQWERWARKTPYKIIPYVW